MLAGSREESAQLAARWVRSQGAAGESTVVTRKSYSTSAANAALANGSQPIRSTTIISAIKVR